MNSEFRLAGEGRGGGCEPTIIAAKWSGAHLGYLCGLLFCGASFF